MNDAELRAAARKIRDAVPNARFSWTDYESSLSVAHPTEQRAFIVYQAPRDDRGRGEIVGDVDAIIASLKA
jgi:hypothetical protein